MNYNLIQFCSNSVQLSSLYVWLQIFTKYVLNKHNLLQKHKRKPISIKNLT